MGMYTEIFVNARIKNNIEVVDIIKYMLGEGEKPNTLPNHPLFEDPDGRWIIMLTCSSYYHIPQSVHLFEYDKIGEYWCLTSRSDFKNYDNEVEKFFDWIRTCLDEPNEPVMIGYSRYEERYTPTIHFSCPG